MVTISGGNVAYSTTVIISKQRLEQAKKLRDELDSLIETAEILNNKALMRSIKRSERDLKEGRFTKVSSRKELNDFFKG